MKLAHVVELVDVSRYNHMCDITISGSGCAKGNRLKFDPEYLEEYLTYKTE